MRAEADVEGYRFLERLFDELNAGTTRFEPLLAAYVDDELAGIGGLTLDPVVAGALRIQRFYVRAAFRRLGIGRKLVEALLAHARRTGRGVTVNAGHGSEAFWEALGFVPDRYDGHTHVLIGTDGNTRVNRFTE